MHSIKQDKATLALEAFKNSEFRSMRQAAIVFGGPESTVRTRDAIDLSSQRITSERGLRAPCSAAGVKNGGKSGRFKRPLSQILALSRKVVAIKHDNRLVAHNSRVIAHTRLLAMQHVFRMKQ